MTEKEITWADIEKLLEEGEREKEKREEEEKESVERRKRIKQRLVELPGIGIQSIPYKWAKLGRKKAAKKYMEKFGKPLAAEDEVSDYFSSLSSDIHRFERGIKSVKTREEKMKVLDDLMKSVRQRTEDLEHGVKSEQPGLIKRVAEAVIPGRKTERELKLEKLEQAYRPGLLDKILSYVRAKRKTKVYLFLSALFLIYLIFRNKSSIIGYTVVETVTSNHLSYFLVFVLIICLLVFLIDKK